MLRSVAKLSLRSKIRTGELLRSKDFLPWEKIRKIALIISKRDNVNKSTVDKFIDSTGKYFEVFYIELDSRTPSFHDWHCFTRKDRSILSLPKKKLSEKLSTREFDVVINSCQEIELFSTSVASTLKAPLKCGSTGKYHDVDLIIKKKGINSLIDYLNEVIRYLKMIREK
jgi:hypothetical protein